MDWMVFEFGNRKEHRRVLTFQAQDGATFYDTRSGRETRLTGAHGHFRQDFRLGGRNENGGSPSGEPPFSSHKRTYLLLFPTAAQQQS